MSGKRKRAVLSRANGSAIAASSSSLNRGGRCSALLTHNRFGGKPGGRGECPLGLWKTLKTATVACQSRSQMCNWCSDYDNEQ